MNTSNMLVLRSTGRVCFNFPWQGEHSACPWNQSKYLRVMIPLNSVEARSSQKKVHVQIVRKDSINKVVETTPTLHH
jgi:hypothetical protein